MRFESAGPQLNEADIQAVEAEIGPLPPDLKRQYLTVNGGRPLSPYFETDSWAEFEIDSFLTMRYRRYDDELLLEDYYRMIVVDRAEVSNAFVPFARDSGGNLYFEDRKLGIIYFWAHDVPDDELRRVAGSLAELLGRLHSEEE